MKLKLKGEVEREQAQHVIWPQRFIHLTEEPQCQCMANNNAWKKSNRAEARSNSFPSGTWPKRTALPGQVHLHRLGSCRCLASSRLETYPLFSIIFHIFPWNMPKHKSHHKTYKFRFRWVVWARWLWCGNMMTSGILGHQSWERRGQVGWNRMGCPKDGNTFAKFIESLGCWSYESSP